MKQIVRLIYKIPIFDDKYYCFKSVLQLEDFALLRCSHKNQQH